ncbi:protein-L-isoaspartate O-methyltransferase family protein [Falsiroseomonas stagni]|uniref:Protein-L-isoaspartate O-methyltransferase n=1 Tax=Falsiroseomonas stagni DSM 19981 TaxID=1123062 RepID=A0A1I4E142_9PROT|nr:protein-L-isoaspartate O-methyltransferase [Falsiroseomonas stagni]SFK98929.1 protein-L-isoaspartate(D-aspartate) O-methyltransferase [Falsiroseomonas stagni DSM 19981]
MTAISLSRRALLVAGLALPAVARAQTPAWSPDAFNAAMRASGRNGDISAATFQAVQQRKARALAGIESYLKARFQGEADPAVLRAFAEVPREYFHYNYDGGRPSPGDAYESEAKPWSVGFGSALSDYLGQAYMTQVCAPKPDHVVLEIGTGSGFQSALLSRIVAKQYSIEIIEPLGRGVSRIFEPLGYTNVETRVGDGFFGWPEVEGGFDTIIVTCAAQYVPPAIIQQLKPGGRLVIPIGQPFRRGQFLYIYTKEEDGRVRSRKDVGVYFIPMTGAMMNRPPPPGTPVAPAGEPVAPSPGHAPLPRRPAG